MPRKLYKYSSKQSLEDRRNANGQKRSESFLIKDWGRGTQLACLVLEFAPDADLYVAKVSSAMKLESSSPTADSYEVSDPIDDMLKYQTERGHKPLLFASAPNHRLQNPKRSFRCETPAKLDAPAQPPRLHIGRQSTSLFERSSLVE
ncbi:hypothetical protein K449DRAFT_431970 [Hypoxylon sp. EC38]|nr:hypothetical protein K449DRAFT_431970 [Hypoxylon sp. EC38]